MRTVGRSRRDAAVAVAVLAVMASAAPAVSAAAVVVLGDRQDGAKLRVASGASFVVRLTSSPSTGFTWRPLGPTPGLRLLSQRYDPPSPARRPVILVGRPGVQSFRLRVTAPPGRRVALRFAYRRWWTRVGFGRVWSAMLTVVSH